MRAMRQRPWSAALTILAGGLLLATALAAWGARPPRRAGRARRRPRAARPAKRRLKPSRKKPLPLRRRLRRRRVVRVVPRTSPVVIHKIDPETDEVVRDVGGLPPTALRTSDDKAEAPEARPVVGVGKDLTVTVEVEGRKVPVRLLGVAVPETGTGSGGGPSPGAFLENLLAGEFVYLVTDENLQETDEAGRRVAYLYRAPDGLFVNLELVRQGYAVTAPGYEFQHRQAFQIYQRRARADDRGLWALVDEAPARSEQVARDGAGE